MSDNDTTLVVVQDDFVESKRVQQALLSAETPEEFEKDIHEQRNKWRPYGFKNNDDLDYFCMLPLSDECKRRILLGMRAQLNDK